MKKTKTLNQQLWEKEIKRINRFIKNAEKRGFTFDVVIPEKPQRVSKKAIANLKKMNPSFMYQKATYVDNTGNVMTGTQGRKLERKRAGQKAYQTRQLNLAKGIPTASQIIIENVRALLNSYAPPNHWSDYWKQKKGEDKNKAVQLLDNAVNREGADEIAKRLQARADDLERIINSIMYGSNEEQVQFDLTEFATILLNRSLSMDESAELTEAMEQAE